MVWVSNLHWNTHNKAANDALTQNISQSKATLLPVTNINENTCALIEPQLTIIPGFLNVNDNDMNITLYNQAL